MSQSVYQWTALAAVTGGGGNGGCILKCALPQSQMGATGGVAGELLVLPLRSESNYIASNYNHRICLFYCAQLADCR